MVIFVFVILPAVTSFAVAVLIGEAKGLTKAAVTGHLLLAGGTVISPGCWFTPDWSLRSRGNA